MDIERQCHILCDRNRSEFGYIVVACLYLEQLKTVVNHWCSGRQYKVRIGIIVAPVIKNIFYDGIIHLVGSVIKGELLKIPLLFQRITCTIKIAVIEDGCIFIKS